jgi:hypothetical protein
MSRRYHAAVGGTVLSLAFAAALALLTRVAYLSAQRRALGQ